MAAFKFIIVVILVFAETALSSDSQYMWMRDSSANLVLRDLSEVQATSFNGSSDVTLYLYTQSNPTTALTLSIGNVPSVFNVNNPTRIVIHGWYNAASNMDKFREEYIASGNGYNIILVDWSTKAAEDYTLAKTSAIEVGAYLAEVVQSLVSSDGLDVDTLYIIGHSLGAHAAGVAGYNLNSSPAKIIGCDPAAPLFLNETLANRLDSTDAQFVEVIHTNAGVLGWEDPLGDADFYPNGGSSQPGCGEDLYGSCSHGRSHLYYAESINSKKFVGTICSNYKAYIASSCSGNAEAIMGEWTSTSASGSYYLATNSSSPYALG